MKSPLFKRVVLVGAAFATVAASFVASASAANATVIAAGGSDTTLNVMDAILAQANAPVGDTWVNLNPFATSSVSVPGDANCPTMNFQVAGTTATLPNRLMPVGSGAGRNMLRDVLAGASTYQGCLDIARSSSFSSGSPAAGTGEYYAFALDAVSWATGSLSAPGGMSLDSLRKIYNCTYTDWSEVPGGSAGQIQRYLPQTSSGTYGFFLSDLLGSSSFNFGTTSASCPAVKYVNATGGALEENNASVIAPADWQSAIFPYSAGQWVYQANNASNPTIDKRVLPSGGAPARLGGILTAVDGTTGLSNAKLLNANPAAYNVTDRKWQLNDAGLSAVQGGASGGYPITEAASTKVNSVATFPGVRFVYNVLDSRSPDYVKAVQAVGFDNSNGGIKSAVCNGSRAAVIASFGFAPLPTAGVTGSVAASANYNLAGSTCRKIVA